MVSSEEIDVPEVEHYTDQYSVVASAAPGLRMRRASHSASRRLPRQPGTTARRFAGSTGHSWSFVRILDSKLSQCISTAGMTALLQLVMTVTCGQVKDGTAAGNCDCG